MPKIGTEAELTAAEVWAASARTLTDISVEEILDLPCVDDYYKGINVGQSATPNTFGSSVEISADVGVGKRLLFVLVTTTAANESTNVQLEFRDAGAGGGNLVALVHIGGVNTYKSYLIPLRVALADNSALHVRVKSDVSAAVYYPLGVQVA